MPRLLISSALLATALLGPAHSPAPAQPSRLQVASYPDGLETRFFRLTTTGAGVRIAGSVTLAAGRDTILATPVGLDLEPGAAATLDASGTGGVSLLILPDSGGDGSAYQAGGPLVRIDRSAAGRYSVREAREGRRVEVRVF